MPRDEDTQPDVAGRLALAPLDASEVYLAHLFQPGVLSPQAILDGTASPSCAQWARVSGLTWATAVNMAECANAALAEYRAPQRAPTAAPLSLRQTVVNGVLHAAHARVYNAAVAAAAGGGVAVEVAADDLHAVVLEEWAAFLRKCRLAACRAHQAVAIAADQSTGAVFVLRRGEVGVVRAVDGASTAIVLFGGRTAGPRRFDLTPR